MDYRILVDRESGVTKCYYCGKCGIRYIPALVLHGENAHGRARAEAEYCCGPERLSVCNFCNKEYKKTCYTACDECLERKKLKNAEIVEEGDHGVFTGYDQFHPDGVDGLLDFFACEKSEPPFYCHPGKPYTADSLDASHIIEGYVDGHHDDACDGVDEGALQTILDKWTKDNPVTSIGCEDHKIIILGQQRFDKFMCGPKK